MTTDLHTILRQIAEVQAERRKNWHGRTEPKDAALENDHLMKLEQLRSKLP